MQGQVRQTGDEVTHNEKTDSPARPSYPSSPGGTPNADRNEEEARCIRSVGGSDWDGREDRAAATSQRSNQDRDTNNKTSFTRLYSLFLFVC